MKTKLFLCLLFLISNIFLFSENVFLGGMTQSITISDDKIEIMAWFDNNNEISINESYELSTYRDFTIMKTESIQFLYFNSSRWIYLLNENYPPLYGNKFDGQGAVNEGKGNLLFKFINESSSLQEETRKGTINYSANRLLDMDIREGWVEGIVGNGIGEKLEFQLRNDWKTSGIVLYNGFIYPELLDLYYANARVKKVEITVESGKSYIYDIIDTPQEQIIELPEKSNSFTLKILEVYPGDKYEDLAISGLFADAEKTELPR